ncbi:pantoate--beta-alanine ligase [Capnocytophaga sp.]|uniref:pantoate--beta-alanine ligase n=1 Tax=Capnocytophaga sp. TaxID=44737 RepID=UPI0026DD9BDA|nr:pantoate--beta-alanine ligase [Capnocytophaga sp.]MDO5106308.1 pantoate--beta-alanine ligase [Capnocytophaga sp.]
MKIYTQQNELKNRISNEKKSGKTIGFVPTMGALHEGHLSLIIKSIKENDITVTSIFVNPTQFNNSDDLKKYPRTLEADVQMIKKISNEVLIYAPDPEDIYGNNVVSEKFDFNGLDKIMEGAFRAGHFDGVGTVVKKLFEIVMPNKAYFGEKDFQQLLIIKQMVIQTKLPVEVIPCPIVRDKNGLALSSRNQRLSPQRQEEAAHIYKTLTKAQELFKTQTSSQVEKWVKSQFENKKGFDLEYFTITSEDNLAPIDEKQPNQTYRFFIAVYVDGVRLIDNLRA